MSVAVVTLVFNFAVRLKSIGNRIMGFTWIIWVGFPVSSVKQDFGFGYNSPRPCASITSFSIAHKHGNDIRSVESCRIVRLRGHLVT